MNNKSIRDYINLIENAQQGVEEAKGINEGIMDQIKNIYRDIVYDEEPLPDDKFLSIWQRSIQKHLGKTIDIDTLARLHQEFRDKYHRLARRGEALKWDQEMGQMWEQGVAEGLNEFAPDGFNGGDDDEEFSPKIAKMAQEDGFTKGVSLADGATLERAMKINYWHSQHGGIYKQYFAKGFKAGRMNKVKHDNKQYNLNLKLMKDGSIRHGEQGVAEEQLEETTPEAVEKVERLTQK